MNAHEASVAGSHPAAARSGVQPKKKGTRKGKKRNLEGEDNADEECECGTKKCQGKCKKELPLTDFYADQSRCKFCAGKDRAWGNKQKNELGETEVERMKAQEPEKYTALEKAFSTDFDKCKKDNLKSKFSCKTFFKSFEASSGLRFEARAFYLCLFFCVRQREEKRVIE